MAKELSDSLESKYMAEDASNKKFLDFTHTLKHGKDNLSLVQLGSHLRIEESLRTHDSDKGNGKEVAGPSVNMTEEGVKNKHHKQNKSKNGPMRKTVVLVPTRNQSWNVRNSGATTHVCKDRCWFKTYEPVVDRSVLYMGDDHFAPVHGKGSVALEFSSGKTITLFNVLYVPKLSSYTPQQNGVTERRNKALKKMVNSVLSYSGLSEGFWGEAMLTVWYLLNRVPNKRNKTTPYELCYKKRPDLSFLRVWGCRVVARLPDPKRKTFGEKGIDCIFVGYAEHSKACRFYVIEPNDSVSINSIIESRDAIFDENPILVEGSRDQVGSQYSYCYSIKEDPRTYNEVIQSRDATFWKEAVDDKIGSIMENNTWVLSDLPPGCKSLVCK
nr:zinc finger, CCHC-type [Tanacetum cinerariifolium]